MAINYLKSIDLIERTVTLLDGTLLPFGRTEIDDHGMAVEVDMPDGGSVLIALDITEEHEVICH